VAFELPSFGNAATCVKTKQALVEMSFSNLIQFGSLISESKFSEKYLKLSRVNVLHSNNSAITYAHCQIVLKFGMLMQSGL